MNSPISFRRRSISRKSSLTSFTYMLRKLDDVTLINSWYGDKHLDDLYYVYLAHKYNQKCLIGTYAGVGITFVLGNIVPEYHPVRINALKQIENIIPLIVECITKNTEVFFIPVGITFGDGAGHVNLLIYRNIKKVFERYEPQGREFSSLNPIGNELIDQAFIKFVQKINENFYKKENVKYVDSSSTCPRYFGLQNLEGKSKLKKEIKETGGYCAAWSMFFTELVLLNPTLSSSDILNKILSDLEKMTNRDDYLRQIIRNYIDVIKRIVERKLKVIFEKKVSYEDFIEILKKYRSLEPLSSEEITLLQYFIHFNSLYLQANLNFINIENYNHDQHLQQINQAILDKNSEDLKRDSEIEDLIDLKEQKKVAEKLKEFNFVSPSSASSSSSSLSSSSSSSYKPYDYSKFFKTIPKQSNKTSSSNDDSSQSSNSSHSSTKKKRKRRSNI